MNVSVKVSETEKQFKELLPGRCFVFTSIPPVMSEKLKDMIFMRIAVSRIYSLDGSIQRAWDFPSALVKEVFIDINKESKE